MYSWIFSPFIAFINGIVIDKVWLFKIKIKKTSLISNGQLKTSQWKICKNYLCSPHDFYPSLLKSQWSDLILTGWERKRIHDSSVFICVKSIGSNLWEDVIKLAGCVFSPKWCKFRLLSSFVPRLVTFKARLNPEKCDSLSEIIIDWTRQWADAAANEQKRLEHPETHERHWTAATAQLNIMKVPLVLAHVKSSWITH